MENTIDVVLTSENKKTILQELMNVKSGMPYLIRLSEEDRKSLLKMDDGCKERVGCILKGRKQLTQKE